MRNILKRFTAALLLVCLLATFIVPVNFTVTAEGTQEVIAEYSITLYDAAADKGYNSWFDRTKAISALKTNLDNAYNAGNLNWTWVDHKDGAEITYRKGNAYTLRTQGGSNWNALKIRVPEAGNYSLTYSVNPAKATHSANVTAYIFKADLLPEASDSTVTALMTEQNCVGTKAMSASATGVSFNAMNFEAGEYIVVYEGSGLIYLDKLALVGEVATGETTGSSETTEGSTATTVDEYNIRLYNETDIGYNSWFTKTIGISALSTKINAAYNEETLNWAYVNASDVAGTTYRADAAYFLRIKTKNNWVALKLRVPASGDFTLTHTLDRTKAATGASFTAYAFPAADLTENTIDAISAKMIPENSLGTKSMADVDTVAFAEKTYTAGEYIVVLKNSALAFVGMLALVEGLETEETTAPTETTQTTTQTTTGVTTEATTEATEETTQPIIPDTPTESVVYDFELYKNTNFQSDATAYSVDATTGRILADFQAHRAYDGTNTIASWFFDNYGTKINWGIESGKGSDSNPQKIYMFRGTNDQGMRLRLSAAAQYAAIRIHVPVSGEYALVLEAGSNANTVDIFTFKAPKAYSSSTLTSAAAIEGAMNDENMIQADLKLKANEKHNLGKYTFLTEGDYIVAFKVKESLSEGVSLRSLTLAVPGSGEDVTEPTVDPNAPTEPEKPDVAVADGFFDFEVYNYKAFSGITTTMSFIKKYGNGKTVGAQMRDSYPASVNWKVEAYSSNIKEENIIVRGGSYRQGLRVDTAKDDWIAFRLNVTKSGAYDVVFNTNNAVYSTIAYPYIFPATGEAMTAAQIEAGMVDDNKLATVSLNGQRMSSNAGLYTFAPGEYILVLKANSSRICMSSIALQTHIEVAPKEPADKMTYNFHLVSVDPNFPQSSITKYTDDTKTERIYTKIAKMYADNVIDWKYETSGTGGYPSIRATYMRFKSTVDWIDVEDAWNAFRIESPGAGIYDVRLNCVDSNTAVANIYLIPAETGVPMAAADIKAAMTKENLLISKARLSGKGTFYLGEFTFGTNEEYVLVLQFVRGKRLNLINIEVTKDGLVADGKLPVGKTYPGVVYDLDLGDSFEGILQPYGEYRYDMPTPKEAGYASPLDQANAAWKSGRLNWKWEMSSDGLVEKNTKGEYVPTNMMRFYSGTGMRLYGARDAWVALRIKSPGAGDFTISLNHATCPNSGTIAMYILPGDTAKEDIWAATDPKNRVGKVVLTNEYGTEAVVDGANSFVGYWNFEAGKEYILVLECYENSTFASSSCQMNISQILMQKGILETEQETEKKVKPITVADNVVRVVDAGMFTAVTEVNGHDYYFVKLEGGTLLVYDLDTNELIDEQNIGGTRGRNMAVAPDGKVWIGDTKYLVCYDPVTLTWKKTDTFPGQVGFNCTGIQNITIDPDGIIYMTMVGNNNVLKYDPKTERFTKLFAYPESVTYATAIIYHEGYLYATFQYDKKFNCVVKYNIATGQIEGNIDIMELTGTTVDTRIRCLSVLGENMLAVGVVTEYKNRAIVINMDTMELMDIPELPGTFSWGVTSPIEGKQYAVIAGYGLYEYDVATGVFSKSAGFGSGGVGFRSGDHNSFGSSTVTLDGQLCLISHSTTGGHPRIWNLETKEYYEWQNVVYGVGGGSDVVSMTNGEPGSGLIYAGTWNTDYAVSYNINTGKQELTFKTAGQSDSILWYKDKLYAACYSATVLVECYPETNEVVQRFKLDHEITGQKRLPAITAGDGYVFVGTIPDSGLTGGAVTSYNTQTGEYHYKRHIVQDQSPISLAYHDGIVYCGMSRYGGDSAQVVAGSALIAAYDHQKDEVLATLDVRKHIKGLASPVDYIYGVTADPNVAENGRIWAIVSETLFCFTFDKENKTFDVQEVISFGKNEYSTTSAVNRQAKTLYFDTENNYVYASFYPTGGGMQRIELADWNAPIGKVKVAGNQRIMGYTPEDWLIAEDGNLYFGNGGDIMMLPLNVTDEDWAIAEKVDAMFREIHSGEITVETESAIRTARSAYENLSWYYKALILNLELLYEAESDVLECKIAATLTGLTVDADAYPVLQPLVDAYKTLNKRQQRYVKNYKDLKESYDLASDLNDARIAEAMQKKVDALKDLFPIDSLDKEPAVVAVRTEFETLTGGQKLLVDTTILKEAEAQVAVLRVEFVKQVEALIQAIPAEITLEAEPAIMEARAAMDKLYSDERKQVSFAKLDQAEMKLRTLKNAKSAAENVDMLIKEIGIVTLGDKARIAEARKAYNALNETGRAFCTKANKLKRAEFILKALQTWGIPVIVIADAGILFAVAWFVPGLHSKIFKKKKQETEELES